MAHRGRKVVGKVGLIEGEVVAHCDAASTVVHHLTHHLVQNFMQHLLQHPVQHLLKHLVKLLVQHVA